MFGAFLFFLFTDCFMFFRGSSYVGGCVGFSPDEKRGKGGPDVTTSQKLVQELLNHVVGIGFVGA